MGSAMNDTTRELGGSLGVAVFGSLLASRYSHPLAPALGALPAKAQAAAEGPLAGAVPSSSPVLASWPGASCLTKPTMPLR